MKDDQFPMEILPYNFGVFETTPEEELKESVLTWFYCGLNPANIAGKVKSTEEKVREILGDRIKPPKRVVPSRRWGLEIGETIRYPLPPTEHLGRKRKTDTLRRSLNDWSAKSGRTHNHEVTEKEFIAWRTS
jgi:hypothetical protein